MFMLWKNNKKYFVYPGLDLSELFLRVAFSFAIGNSNMHLKNFSLKEMEPGKRNFSLSKAYDMLPVNIIMPEEEIIRVKQLVHFIDKWQGFFLCHK